jgi:hypothetical protein
MMSHVLTTSAYGQLFKWGKYLPDTLPQPMTPTRIRFDDAAPTAASEEAAGTAPRASAAPPVKEFCMNRRRVLPEESMDVSNEGSSIELTARADLRDTPAIAAF